MHAATSPRTLAFAGTALCLLWSLWAGTRHIDGTLPYAEHGDERHVISSAARVLKVDGLDPQLYCYPSFPIYLSAAALALGVIKVSGEGPKYVTVKDLGRSWLPIYDHPRVMAVPRKLWVVLGVIALGATAALAYHVAGALAMLITAFALTLAATPTALAWAYINVDVPMVMFVALALCNLLAHRDSDRYRHRVFEPAVLCGAAIACKYNAFLTLLPCLTAVWTYSRRDRVSRSVELALIASVTFLVLCPRFLFDLAEFIDGIAHINYHYKVRGHKHFDVQPGWAQLKNYLGDITDSYGLVFSALSVIGAVALARRDWRAALVLTPFVVLWTAFLSTYQVHFARNLLPVTVLVPVFSAIGVLACWRACRLQLQARRPALEQRAPWLAAAAVTALVALTVPFGRVAEMYGRAEIDSRVRFARWAEQHLDGQEVIIPDALALSRDTLPAKVTPHYVDFTQSEPMRERAKPGSYVLLPEWRTDSDAALVAAQAPGVEALPKHHVVREFKGKPTLPMRPKKLQSNPSFKLVRIDP